MTILTDSSFVYALYNTKDSLHRRAMDFAEASDEITVIPDVILPEVGYLFLRDLGYSGMQQFLASLVQAEIQPAPLERVDLTRAYEISKTYSDNKFDLVDCCIMAMTERLQITKVATFDRRDFSVFRPKHCDYLTLLP